MKEAPHWKRCEFIVRVTEPFLGLDPEIREMTLASPHVIPLQTPALFHLERRPDGELDFPTCSRSVRLDDTSVFPDFARDLAWLRSLRNGKPDRASVVISFAQDVESFSKKGLLEGVIVTLSNDGLRRESVSQKGRAQFHNLPDGRYELVEKRFSDGRRWNLAEELRAELTYNASNPTRQAFPIP
ncbi:MAG: hypothetical protein J0L64_18795 [Acidobacteria bacterium]|nr:hypothetical protein [Acidobacteriota bacterium]